MIRTRNLARLALFAPALLLVLGCGAQSFQAQWKPPAAPNDRVVLAEITKLKPRDERPVAVGVTSDPQRLFAWDLSAGLLWERPIHALSAPLVVADAIVTREQDGIVVRDLASGEVRVVIDDHGDLIGADGQGHAVVVAISYGEADPRGAIAYVEGDSLRWKQALKLPVGVPALVGRYVLVPWATQTLSVLDAQNGGELARWHFNKTVIGHALVDRGRVYIGQHGFMRLSQDVLEKAAQASAVYAPIGRQLPGQPPLLRDGYLKVPEPDNAYHRLQVSWRIAAGDGPMASENDAMVVRFYRLLFTLGANADEIRWVRAFDHDLVGTAVQPGGLFVADSAGVLRFLDGAGETRMQRDLGRPLQVLTIRPGAWVPAAEAAAVEHAPASLHEQLFIAAALEDDRLGAGRAYAVEHLAPIADAAVTANLIELCSNDKSPQPVQLAACAHLSERKTGGDAVVEAMRRRASFLDGAPAPPVGPLAQAAAEMQLKPAGALLVSHMEDPNTKARDLPSVFAALEKLNHRAAGSAIERFVRLHHAEPEGSDIAPALYAALHALGGLHARGARPSLQDIADDALTPNAVRDKAREALVMIDAPLVQKPVVPQKPEPDADDESDEPQTDPRPYALTAPMVRSALAPVRKSLSQCLANDATKPRSARVSVVVQGEGRVEGIFVTPTTLQACMEPFVRETKFPATRVGRQRITHQVFGMNAVADAARKPPSPAPTAKPAKKLKKPD
jgi:hypothetical protein